MTEKPHVILYSDSPVFGGSDAVAAELLRDSRLNERFELSLVYRRGERFERGLSRMVPESARLVPVDFPDRQEDLDALERAPRSRAARLRDSALLRLRDLVLLGRAESRVAAVLAPLRPTLVHINNGGYPGALGCRAAALAARRAGASRVIMTVNNIASARRWPFAAFEAPLDARVAASCDVFVTASQEARRRLLERRFPGASVRQIPNGVRARVSSRPAREVRRALGLPLDLPVVVTTAFFEPRKGHAVLVEAARRCAAGGGPDAHFVLIGDGPQRAPVEAAATAAGLSGRFSFLGYREDAAEILASADILALPSVASEDMPLIVLDAMSLGKPVIASSLAGITEEIDDGRTGLLVPPGDADALAAGLRLLLADAGLRTRLGEAGRRRFEQRFDAALCARAYGDLYDELLSDAVRPQWSLHA